MIVDLKKIKKNHSYKIKDEDLIFGGIVRMKKYKGMYITCFQWGINAYYKLKSYAFLVFSAIAFRIFFSNKKAIIATKMDSRIVIIQSEMNPAGSSSLSWNNTINTPAIKVKMLNTITQYLILITAAIASNEYNWLCPMYVNSLNAINNAKKKGIEVA